MITAVVADGLYEPMTDTRIDDAVVLVEDGRVSAAGTRGEVAIPEGAEVVDARGLTLLPGLIDLHLHLCFRGDGRDEDFNVRLESSASLVTLQAVEACRKTLDAGFTYVRDAGGTPNGVRQAVEQGLFPGPRMALAIEMLSQTGGHNDNGHACGAEVRWNPSPDIPHPIVDGVEPMRKKVREIIKAGGDWIKVCCSGGIYSNDAPNVTQFRVDELRAAVEEAATQGVRVMAHAQALGGTKNALAAGVATVEHGIWLDEEACRRMVETNTTLVTTMMGFIWVDRWAERGLNDADMGEKVQQVLADHGASLRLARETGVKIAVGTDSGVGPHGENGEELAQLQSIGFSAAECIRAATVNAAEVLGLEGEVGTLLPGAFGDLIGVVGAPAEDVSVLADPQNVRLVMKGGEIVKRT